MPDAAILRRRHGFWQKRRCLSIGICRRCSGRRPRRAARGISGAVARALPHAADPASDPGAARLSRRQSDAAARPATASRRCGLLDFQDAVLRPARATTSSRCSRMRGATFRRVCAERCARAISPPFRRSTAPRSRAPAAILGAQRNCKIIGIFTRLWSATASPVISSISRGVWRLLDADLRHPALGDARALARPPSAAGAAPRARLRGPPHERRAASRRWCWPPGSARGCAR